MKNAKLTVFFMLLTGVLGSENLQGQTPASKPTEPPPAVAVETKLSSKLAENLEQNREVSRERREQAYAKLLEGQRFIWSLSRIRSQAGATAGLKLARQAFQRAVELNPNLSEGYTALAEIALSGTPPDIEEAIMLAGIAVKTNPDNFGARRILARVYTIKSRLRGAALDSQFSQKAIAEWKEVARLDPRNAEAWAFLSEFYNKTNKNQERIEVLQKWLSSPAPLDYKFYQAVMGKQEDLSPESASLKLGSAFIKADRTGEAVEILSRAVADNPENSDAIDLLRQAIDGGGSAASSKAALEALQQAVFANPTNLALIKLLAQIQVRMGNTDDAVKLLRASAVSLTDSDKSSAAELQVYIGDIYSSESRTSEAVDAYQQALKIQGISDEELNAEDDREFAMNVIGKLIQTYKNAGLVNDARSVIERARAQFGKNDLFADRQLISLYRETGMGREALQAIRSLRARFKEDYGLLRLEAQVLTEIGKVDEGVALIKPLIGAGKTSSAPSLMYDDFSNYIFISSLYNQAKRGKDAVLSAQKAFTVAGSEEKKQIANLTLATARQTSGEFQAAEDILRNLLKQSPTNPIALNNLGYFLLERNEKIEEAVTLIRQAVEIDPTNSSYLDSLGWAYYKLGKLSEAELYLKEAVNNDSGSATIYEHLGDVYQKQGKKELARQAWQKAINLATDAAVNNRLKEKIISKTDK